ncbi:hypothetical protein PGDDIFCJ_00125 [Thermus phage YS40_Isch]|nr:hypothetical protein PGDDIFCJ_00125 [Thermus phage YS40_Isch]
MKLTSYAKVDSAKLTFARRKDSGSSQENYYLYTSNFSEVIDAFKLLRKRITKEVNHLKLLKQKKEIARFSFNAYSFYSVYFYTKDPLSNLPDRDFYQFQPVFYRIEDLNFLNIKLTLERIVEKTIKKVPTFHEISWSFYLTYDSVESNYETDLKTNLEMTIRITRDDPF